jgi:hypothetical protein
VNGAFLDDLSGYLSNRPKATFSIDNLKEKAAIDREPGISEQ